MFLSFYLLISINRLFATDKTRDGYEPAKVKRSFSLRSFHFPFSLIVDQEMRDQEISLVYIIPVLRLDSRYRDYKDKENKEIN